MSIEAARENRKISPVIMAGSTAAWALVCFGLVTLVTGGRQFSTYTIPVAGFFGGVLGLYGLAWLIAGTLYFLSFGHLPRDWVVYIALGSIIILSCLQYNVLMSG